MAVQHLCKRTLTERRVTNGLFFEKLLHELDLVQLHMQEYKLTSAATGFAADIHDTHALRVYMRESYKRNFLEASACINGRGGGVKPEPSDLKIGA